MAETKKTANLNDQLKKLAEITSWFAGQKEIDIEEGLKKVKEGAALIKKSREQLDNLENEFKEIEKDFSDNSGGGQPQDSMAF